MQQVLKDILSVKGLIMLIALVALGLSITAVVRRCGDDFANTCEGDGCDSTAHNRKCNNTNPDCTHDAIDPTDCKCTGQVGPPPSPTGKCVPNNYPCNKNNPDLTQCCEYDPKDTQNPPITCNNNNGESDYVCQSYIPNSNKTCGGVGNPCFITSQCCKDLVCNTNPLDPPNKSCQYPGGFGPGGNIATNITASHRRTAKHPTSLGLGGNSNTWEPGSKTSAVVNTKPFPPPPPSSDGEFPEWATITLSSVGGVLLLGLVIYLLMRMKHGNKLM